MAYEQIPITREVLRWARKRAGYSLDELKGAFKKLEEWEDDNSGVFPTYPKLEQLADKYKVPVAVFFFPEPPDLPPVEETFRTLGPEQLEQIPPRIRLLLQKARAYQVGLSELNGGQNPAPRLITRDLSFRTNVSIDTMAKRTREYLGIPLEQQFGWRDAETALKNWRSALLGVGVYVFKDQFRQEGYSGFCLYDNEFPIIYANNSTAKTRQIFTLFHELAHLIFHTSGVDALNDDYIDALPRIPQRIEIICNRFAARFLVPENAFERAFAGREPSEATAEDLATLFKVSRESIYRKFLDRGLISQDEYEAAAKTWREQARKSPGGDTYNNKIAYLGQEYINLALSKYYQKQIDESQLADYLDVKPRHLATLEEYMSRRAS